MNNKEGKKETWKRGKVKPEQRKIEMTNEVEKEQPWTQSQNIRMPQFRGPKTVDVFVKGLPAPIWTIYKNCEFLRGRTSPNLEEDQQVRNLLWEFVLIGIGPIITYWPPGAVDREFLI